MKILLLENDKRDYNTSRKWVVDKMLLDSHEVTVLIKDEDDGFRFNFSLNGFFIVLLSMYSNRELFRKVDLVIAYRIESIIYTWLCSFFFPRPKLIFYFTGLGREVNNNKPSKTLRLFFRVFNFFSGDSVAVFQNEEDKKLSKFPRSYVIKGSAVDEAVFSGQRKKKINKVIAYPSRLIKPKGIIQFADIFSKHDISNSYELHIYGNANILDKDRLEKRDLERLNLLRGVEFRGMCNDLKDVYSQVSFCALNSFYGEGTPRALLEAMCMGLPIIARKNRGVDHLFNCDTILSPGFTYENKIELEECFSKIMKMKSTDYHCISSDALTLYDQYFSQKKVYKSLKDIIDKI